MNTETTARRALDENLINALHADGEIDTLAQALRNIITVTDNATHSAMAAARERQEYVPTTLLKDSLYQAMDAAVNPDDTRELGSALHLDHDDEEPHVDEVGEAYRDAYSVMDKSGIDFDDLPAAFTAEQSRAFSEAAVTLVLTMCDCWHMELPAQDTETRGTR